MTSIKMDSWTKTSLLWFVAFFFCFVFFDFKNVTVVFLSAISYVIFFPEILTLFTKFPRKLEMKTSKENLLPVRLFFFLLASASLVHVPACILKLVGKNNVEIVTLTVK